MKNIIEVDGNWKKFAKAQPSDEILLLHATSLDKAEKITTDGFSTEDRNWLDSEDGFVYLAGSRYNLGTYLRYTENAIIRVSVKKENILPDNNSVDWNEYVRLHHKDLVKDKVDIHNPTSFDTFKHIGQVKARIEDITIIDYKKL